MQLNEGMIDIEVGRNMPSIITISNGPKTINSDVISGVIQLSGTGNANITAIAAITGEIRTDVANGTEGPNNTNNLSKSSKFQ